MTIITFNSIESEEGKKLLLEFPYDEEIINTIKKELPYSKTEYGYHKPGDSDSPLTGIYDSNCWFANFDAESFNAIEQHLETPIPTEYWDEAKTNTEQKEDADDKSTTSDEIDKTNNNKEKHPERVQITKTDTGRLTIEPWGTAVKSLISERINNEFTTGDGEGDGFFTRISTGIDTGQEVLPIGVYSCIKEALEAIGIETVTIDNRDVGECKNISWRFKHGLLPHQRDTVNEIIEKKNGIVLTSTGNDKGVIPCRVIYELNRDATIVTTDENRVKKWNKVINEILNVERKTQSPNNNDVSVVTYDEVISVSDSEEISTDIAIFDECQQREVTENVLDASLNCNAKYRIGLSPVSLKGQKTLFSEVLSSVGTTEIGYSVNDLQEKDVIADISVTKSSNDVINAVSSEKNSIVIVDEKYGVVDVNEKLKENNDKMNTTTVEVMENMTKTGTYDEVVLITTTTLSLKEAQKILRVINPKDGEKEIKCMESETSKKTLKQYEDTFNLLTKNDANTTKMKTNTMTKGMKTAG